MLTITLVDAIKKVVSFNITNYFNSGFEGGSDGGKLFLHLFTKNQ